MKFWLQAWEMDCVMVSKNVNIQKIVRWINFLTRNYYWTKSITSKMRKKGEKFEVKEGWYSKWKTLTEWLASYVFQDPLEIQSIRTGYRQLHQSKDMIPFLPTLSSHPMGFRNLFKLSTSLPILRIYYKITFILRIMQLLFCSKNLATLPFPHTDWC